MKATYYIIIFICFNLFTPLWSQTEEPLTLDQCIALALKNNNLYKSQQHKYLASQARVRQAYAFPQPEISLDYDLQPKLFKFKQPGESYIGINQSIEFPGRRYLRGKIAGKESDMTACELDLVRKEIIYNVKRSFYELLFKLEIQKYTEANLEMARNFFAKTQEKYDSGDTAKFEMLQAKVETARAGNQLEVSINQVKLATAQLNFFLAREKFQPLQVQGKLKAPLIEIDLQTALTLALASHPDIKKEQLAVKKETLIQKQAALSFLPDVSLGLSRHRIQAEPSTWDTTISFQVPLFFWQKINGEIAESNANRRAAQERLKYLELSISLDIENAYYNVISLKNQVELFEKEVLEEAEQVYQMSITSYQEGKTGSIQSIEARRSLASIKQDYAETLFNYQVALAELEKTVGTSMTGLKHETARGADE